MTQAQLDRAVARATGESVAFIRGMGFGLLSLPRPPELTRAANRLRRYRRRRARIVGRPAGRPLPRAA
jgi:hypothetical protein